jgi:hypothetical protein
MDRFIALARPSSMDTLTKLAKERGWLPLSPTPWRFHGGMTRGFITPNGVQVNAVDQTLFGAFVISVLHDNEGLAAELSQLFELLPVETLGRKWDEATTSAEKVQALLWLSSAQALAGGHVIPAFEAAVRKALDDTDAVVRLTGIRALAIGPMSLGKELLEGREDADNPGLKDWYELFAQNAGNG